MLDDAMAAAFAFDAPGAVERKCQHKEHDDCDDDLFEGAIHTFLL